MIQFLIRVVESPFVFGMRVSLLLGLSILIFSSVAIAWQSDVSQANLRGMELIANEHRFSVLETEMSVMKAKLEDLSLHSYLQLLALSGIIGETGIRILKGKKST